MNRETSAWLNKQVSDYENLPRLQTARWQATIAVGVFLLFIASVVLYNILVLSNSEAFIPANTLVSLGVVALLAWFAHRGKSWAILALMTVLTIQILLLFGLVNAIVLLIIINVPLWRSYTVEKARGRSNSSSPTSGLAV